MFEKKIHALECREDTNVPSIYDLRAKYLDPDDVYLATIDMSNGANPYLHHALVN